MGDANAALINGNVVTFATQHVFLVKSYVVNMFVVRVRFIHGLYRVDYLFHVLPCQTQVLGNIDGLFLLKINPGDECHEKERGDG